MPVISSFYGILIMMFFDDHNPPHFHVKYGEYRAIITIEDGVVKGELPRRALTLIFDWIDLHKDELMDNWQLIQSENRVNKIEPLK